MYNLEIAMKMIMFVAPLSTSFTPCTLLLPPGGPVVFLQWSPSFTSQHAVERYRVVVTPDPSSCSSQQVSPSEDYTCSSQQVSPSEDYTCSRLVLGTKYFFTVSAINCGNQEGTRETFTIQPQGIYENDGKGVARFLERGFLVYSVYQKFG